MGFRVRSLNQDQYPGRQGCGGEHVVDQVLLITSIAEGILRRAEGSDDADMLEANRPKFTIKKKTNH